MDFITKKRDIPVEVINDSAYKQKLNLRCLSRDDFASKYGSGTFDTSLNISMAVRNFYLEERVAFEFGWEFMVLPVTKVKRGKPVSEGDESSITNFTRYAKRVNWNLFYGDKIVFEYIHVDLPYGIKKEGLAFVVEETSAPWLPDNHVIFALVVEFNTKTGEWEEALNPY